MMKDVVIIGAGLSGLACGLRLAKAGYKVTVLEKEAIPGGLARSFPIQGQRLPLTYHHVMPPDQTTQAYIKRFGLWDRLHWINSSQVFWHDRIPYPLSRPWHILFFRPLDWGSRLRLLYLGLHVWFKRDWTKLDAVDCETWLNRIAGRRTVEMLFKKLFDIKFNLPLSSVSAAWLARRMHQSVRSRDRYGYIDGGWQELLDRMAEEIVKRQGRLVMNFKVSKVSGTKVEGEDSAGNTVSLSADIIVSTVPPPILDSVLNMPDARGGLRDVRYKSLISFVCASPSNLSPHYWSVVLRPHLIFGGFFNQTVLSPASASDGKFIYYFFTYLDDSDGLFKCSDQEIAARYAADIRRICADFSMDWFRVFRLRHSQPVFVPSYRNLPIALTENIYLAGVYRQYPRPRTMDAALYSGGETAEHIINRYGKD